MQSYATGSVTASGFDMKVGGLAGMAQGTIRYSFASGPVKATSTINSQVGGLVGDAAPQSLPQFPTRGIFSSFATGSVTSIVGTRDAYAGGWLAWCTSLAPSTRLMPWAGSLSTSRRVSNLADFSATIATASTSTCSGRYWNTQTMRVARSDGGAARNTTQLQASLPPGFNSSVSGITPGVTFPYLKLAGTDFQSPLAITVLGSEIFTFLPISQLEKSEYSPPISRPDLASKAAAYTIIARAIGITRRIATLQNARINGFWNGSAAVWKGAATSHASLGPLTAIASATPLGSGNLIGPLRAHKIVLLRGSYTAGATVKPHWLLATSFKVSAAGSVTGIVANDPWTGRQVRIDPATKRVSSPLPFPLSGFRINGFQVVTLKPA